jgi:hypothetical protein
MVKVKSVKEKKEKTPEQKYIADLQSVFNK